MKRFLILLAAVLTLGMASAQTLNVQVGNVIYRVPAYQAEVMNFADGATLTILGKTFPISDIEQLYVDNTTVTDNVVDVTYNGTTASVAVPANLMSLLDVSVSGADVSITQAETLADEVTYTLSGNSTNGSFTMAGQLKSTVVLNGLTLTSTTGAPLTINNGKRINIEVADGTTNTLVDAASGAQKACFFVKGHAEFSGGGTLNITGNAKHAYRSNEYTLLKKKFTGKINILGAASDGFHVEEYFQQNAGEVTITGIDGDGIQVDYATDDDGNIEESTENTGEIILKDGKITISTTAAACKGLKAEGNVLIQGGTLDVTQSGDLEVTDDLSYSTAVKSDADINITGGTITMKITGAGQTLSNNRYTAKGIKTDGNLVLSAGNLSVTTTQAGAKGIKVNGAYTQGTSDGEGPTVYISTSGSRFGTSSSSGWGGGGMGGKTTGQGGAAKAIKAMGAVVIYGGSTEIHTAADGGEGLESRTSIDIRGGQHYIATYDDCISTTGTITFNGGVTVAYSNGNDAVDSNYGRTGAITIGNGTIFAFSTKGGAEEGLDCDNNSYIQITGKGIAISAGGSQGGGGGWGGGSSSISGAAQGYYLSTSSVSYSAGRYYTLADSSGKNLVTYSFPASLSSNLSLLTATGMVKGSSYTVKYSTTAPTDATTAFHGLYLGSSATGTSSVINFTAQ